MHTLVKNIDVKIKLNKKKKKPRVTLGFNLFFHSSETSAVGVTLQN